MEARRLNGGHGADSATQVSLENNAMCLFALFSGSTRRHTPLQRPWRSPHLRQAISVALTSWGVSTPQRPHRSVIVVMTGARSDRLGLAIRSERA